MEPVAEPKPRIRSLQLVACLSLIVSCAAAAILVNVPEPARFALHKLLVAQDRPAAFQAKSRKDVVQAANLVTALAELRPGDLDAAATTVRAKGKGWRDALDRGEALLAKHDPKVGRLLPQRRAR